MLKTTFLIKKMDCPAEEALIRMRLENFPGLFSIDANIPERILSVLHSGDPSSIHAAIDELKLDSMLLQSVPSVPPAASETEGGERKILLLVLSINAFFFVLEVLVGFFSHSMGLIADGLDMLADSLVYGMALFAVRGTTTRKQNIALISGYFQLILAVSGFTEVLRRFFGFAEMPSFQAMIIVSTLALAGNTASLFVLQKNKNREIHMQASRIFTSNDVVMNIGVILAGVMVLATGSNLPDLIVGALVFIIVGQGAFRILRMASGKTGAG
jgi:Co/Zn/Cd efflux system component